jgi:hypothetical protein
MFQRLGNGTLVSILRNPEPPVENDGPKKSGSEYEPQGNEGCEEEVSMVQILFNILLCV